jgi:hypothetical protein
MLVCLHALPVPAEQENVCNIKYKDLLLFLMA